MRQPQHLAADRQRQFDRLDDVALASAALRAAVARRDRVAIETCCASLARRLALSPIDFDDADEIRATIRLIEAQVKFGVHERLRKFLQPLVAAVECQIEEAERNL
jgi:hypothetical protein